MNYKVYRKYGMILCQGRIISNPENIILGKNFLMSPHCHLFAQGKKGDANIHIGNNVALNFNVMINADCGGEINIGDNVRIGPYTIIRASNHRFDDVTKPIFMQGHSPGIIKIEEDVWIGAHVTILPNILIGRSSVVAAGSVVVDDLPPFTVSAGIPAKVLKNRKNFDN